MNILVTGCGGFIGWKVSELLLEAGHLVVGIDNMNDAYDPRLKEWRLNRLCFNEGFRFEFIDIREIPMLAEIFNHNNFDAVVHLAALAGVRQSIEDPLSFYNTNVMGTVNILEFCRNHCINKLIIASTSSVYGDQERPFVEHSQTDSPLSPYAASKKAVELACHSYHVVHDLDISVLRYFTVYGPAGRPDMSVFRFIRQISEDETLTINGNGLQERDFTYVEDIANGVIAALKPVGFEIINLGNDNPTVLKDMISLLERLLDKKAAIVYGPSHPADAYATWANINKAREILKWEPTVSLEDGLRRCVSWYKENRDWAKTIM